MDTSKPYKRYTMEAKQIFAAYVRANSRGDRRYEYCPVCGTPLSPGDPDSRQRDRCPHCNWVHFQNPSPGVAVLIPEG